ncbi:carbohydrate kinase [Erysipelotrichaceae bacterium RD49]|nr:carbohydrate kinase [Erysipelotrichaceae bacterium RD49]
MKTDVTAFGEILIDFTFDGVNENGAALFAQHPGGAPANVCVGVKRLGGSSAFMGKTGADMHGKMLKGVLDAEGVDVCGMVEDGAFFTTLAFVSVGPDGEREFSFARKPGADTQMTFEEMNKDLITNSKIFHVGSLSLTDEPARSACLKAIELAKANGVLISYDPNYRASLWNCEADAIGQMRSLTPYADIMKISDEETALLSGNEDPEAAAKILLAQGPKIVAVTLGSKGALVANQEGVRIVDGFKSEVADTNGAGDSFWAAMLKQVADTNKPLEDIDLDTLADFLRFANATAALTVRKHGAIPAMPTGQAVAAFLEEADA